MLRRPCFMCVELCDVKLLMALILSISPSSVLSLACFESMQPRRCRRGMGPPRPISAAAPTVSLQPIANHQWRIANRRRADHPRIFVTVSAAAGRASCSTSPLLASFRRSWATAHQHRGCGRYLIAAVARIAEPQPRLHLPSLSHASVMCRSLSISALRLSRLSM